LKIPTWSAPIRVLQLESISCGRDLSEFSRQYLPPMIIYELSVASGFEIVEEALTIEIG
jgi:hypothetical protein